MFLNLELLLLYCIINAIQLILILFTLALFILKSVYLQLSFRCYKQSTAIFLQNQYIFLIALAKYFLKK